MFTVHNYGLLTKVFQPLIILMYFIVKGGVLWAKRAYPIPIFSGLKE